MTPEDERRAHNLQRFMEDGDVKEMLAGCRADILQSWQNELDAPKREEWHAEIRALDRLIRKKRGLVGRKDVGG